MVDDNVIEAEVMEGGSQALPSTPLLPTTYEHGNTMPALNATREITMPAGDAGLLMSKQRRTNFIKTRPGAGGGIVRYTGWTNTADMLDYALGPLAWSIEVVEVQEFPEPDTSAPGKVLIEYVVHCKFHAIGLIHPMDVYGSHKWQQKNPNASRSDAIESAISKALSKAGARISERMRSVWGKDDEAMQELMGASAQQVTTIKNLVAQLTNMGKDKQVKAALAKKGVTEESVGGLSATNITALQVELAGLLSD